MADRLSSNSIILIGGGLAIIAIWLLTSLAVVWDTRQRNFSKSKRLLWIVVAVFLPLFGFALYMIFLVIQRFILLTGSRLAGDDLKQRPLGKSGSPQRSFSNEGKKGDEQDIQLQPTLGGGLPVRPNGKNQVPISNKRSPGNILTINHVATSCVFSVISGPYEGEQFTLNHFPALIGRGTEAAIRLDKDLNVSRQHCELSKTGAIIRIRDLNSSHGTLVNGTLVQECMINPGDNIQVGSTLLLFGGSGQGKDGQLS